MRGLAARAAVWQEGLTWVCSSPGSWAALVHSVLQDTGQPRLPGSRAVAAGRPGVPGLCPGRQPGSSAQGEAGGVDTQGPSAGPAASSRPLLRPGGRLPERRAEAPGGWHVHGQTDQWSRREGSGQTPLPAASSDQVICNKGHRGAGGQDGLLIQGVASGGY